MHDLISSFGGSEPPRSLVRVAVVQPRGFPFQTASALDAVRETVAEAAREGAKLIVFPEAFLGGYPWGLRFGTVIGGRSPIGKQLFQAYWEQAVVLPGPEASFLGEVARTHGVYLAIGVIERLPGQASTLYCTLATFGPNGALLGIHRKLKPTAAERLVWGEGDGSTLPVFDTPHGRIGGLICWENYMPLARMALYGKGVEIYLAPTADARDRWQATLRHIAIEGRCFVLGCNQFVTRRDYEGAPAAIQGALTEELGPNIEGAGAVLSPGGSSIWGPDGTCLAAPLLGESGVLYADLDPEALTRERLEFDVVGHYARPDVFRLQVDERPRRAVDYHSIDPSFEGST